MLSSVQQSQSPASPADALTRHPINVSKSTTGKMQAAFLQELGQVELVPYDQLPAEVKNRIKEQMREAEEKNDQDRIEALLQTLPSSKKVSLTGNLAALSSKRSRVSFGTTGPINQRTRPNGTTPNPKAFQNAAAGEIKT